MNGLLHISSLLITAKPDHVPDVIAKIDAMPIAEVAQSTKLGKIIVALETLNESEIVQALTDIQLINGVVNAGLVYHHSEAASLANSAADLTDAKGNLHV